MRGFTELRDRHAAGGRALAGMFTPDVQRTERGPAAAEPRGAPEAVAARLLEVLPKPLVVGQYGRGAGGWSGVLARRESEPGTVRAELRARWVPEGGAQPDRGARGAVDAGARGAC